MFWGLKVTCVIKRAARPHFAWFGQSNTSSQWQSRNLTFEHLFGTLTSWQPYLPAWWSQGEVQKIREGIVTVQLRPDDPPATADTWSMAMCRRTPYVHLGSFPNRVFGTITKAPAQSTGLPTGPSPRQSREIINSISQERFLFVLVLLWTDREAYLFSQHQPDEKPYSACDKVTAFWKRHCATFTFDWDSKGEISSLWGFKKHTACKDLARKVVSGVKPHAGRAQEKWCSPSCGSNLQAEQSLVLSVRRLSWGERSGRWAHFPLSQFPPTHPTKGDVRISWWTHAGCFDPAAISTRKAPQTQEKQDASSSSCQTWAHIQTPARACHGF